MDCYESDQLLTSFLYAAEKNYFDGDFMTGDAMMECAKPLYATALKKCDKTSDSFESLNNYYTDWESQPDSAQKK